MPPVQGLGTLVLALGWPLAHSVALGLAAPYLGLFPHLSLEQAGLLWEAPTGILLGVRRVT